MTPHRGHRLAARNVLVPLAVVLPALFVYAAFSLGAREADLLREQQAELDLAASRLAHRLSGIDQGFHAALGHAHPERPIAIPIETPGQTELIDFPTSGTPGTYPPRSRADSEENSRAEPPPLRLFGQWHIASAGRPDATFVLYDPEDRQSSVLPAPLHLLLAPPTLPAHLDGVVLMTADGRVLYQAGLSRFTVSREDLFPLYEDPPATTAQSDFPPDPSAGSPDSSAIEQRFARTSSMRPREVPRLEISGTAYRPILSPVDLTALEAEPHGSVTQTLYLCGLLRPSTIRRAAAQRVMVSVPAIVVLALLGVGLPFLWRARRALRISPLAPAEVSVAMKTALLTVSMATILILHYSHELLPAAHIDHVLRQVAREIHSGFELELREAGSSLRSVLSEVDEFTEAEDFKAAVPDSTPGRVALLKDQLKYEIEPPGDSRWTWRLDFLWHPEEPLSWGPGGSRRTLPSAAVTPIIPLGEREVFRRQLTKVDRVRTTGSGLFVAAIRHLDGPAVLDVYFGSLIRPALPHPVGMAVVDRSGDVLYHSEEQLVLVENHLSRTSEAPNLAQAVRTGSGGLFSARYGGRPHRLLVEPFESVPWTLLVFWDQTFLQLHSFHRFAVTLALLGGYALLLLLADQLLRIFAPRLGWSWTGFAEARERLRSDAWLYLLPLALLSGIAAMTLQGWHLVAVVTATALVCFGLLLSLSFRTLFPFPMQEGRGPDVVAGDEEPALPLRGLRGRAYEALIDSRLGEAFHALRRSRVGRDEYRALLALVLLVLAVFPAVAMFREAHAAVQEIVARRLQLAYADSVVARREGIEQAKLVTGAVSFDRPTYPLGDFDTEFNDRAPSPPWWPTPLSTRRDRPDSATPDQVLRNPEAPGTLLVSHISPGSQRRLTSSTYSYDWYQTPTATCLELPDQGPTVCSGDGR